MATRLYTHSVLEPATFTLSLPVLARRNSHSHKVPGAPQEVHTDTTSPPGQSGSRPTPNEFCCCSFPPAHCLNLFHSPGSCLL